MRVLEVSLKKLTECHQEDYKVESHYQCTNDLQCNSKLEVVATGQVSASKTIIEYLTIKYLKSCIDRNGAHLTVLIFFHEKDIYDTSQKLWTLHKYCRWMDIIQT